MAQTVQNLPLLRLVGAIFGLAFGFAGLAGVREGLESRRWVAAPARILSAQAVGMGDHQSSRIVAEYRWGPYFAHCGQVAIGRDNDPDDVRRYPVGAAIVVRHDPEHVNRCAFQPGVSVASLVFLAVGAGMFGLGLWAHRTLRTTGPG